MASDHEELLAMRLAAKHAAIKKKMTTAQLKQFSKLTTNQARMEFCMGKKNHIVKAFDVGFNYEAKSNEKCHQIRLEGNKLFVKKKYQEALAKYNLSVMYGELTHNLTNNNDNSVKTANNYVHSSSTADPSSKNYLDSTCADKLSNLHLNGVKCDSNSGKNENDKKEAGSAKDAANRAKPEEPPLAMAYANRSAALYHLGIYHATILDIDQAIKMNYPMNMRYKLLDRRGKALMKMNMFYQAEGTLTEALLMLYEAPELSGDNRKFWEQHFNKQIADCEFMQVNEDRKLEPWELTYVKEPNSAPPVTGETNEKYYYTSDAFSIETSDACGRYAKATKDIEIGDVVLNEPPYASVLYPEFYQTHCYNCMYRVAVLLPCQGCASVGYCSGFCKNASWKMHHSVECKYLGWMSSDWMGRLGHLTARLTLRWLYDFQARLNKMLANKNGQPSENASTQDGPPRHMYASNYWEINNLEMHENARSPDVHFEFCLMTIIIMRLIEHAANSGFLNKEFLLKILDKEEFKNKYLYKHEDDEDCEEGSVEEGEKESDRAFSTENLQQLGMHILRHLQIIQVNGYAITEMHWMDFTRSKPIDIGMGIYTTLSLCNHSCDSNVDVVNYGNCSTLIAIVKIQKGEEIRMDYGFVYTTDPLVDRQEALKTGYFFVCKCVACENGWPTFDFISQKPRFKCNDCGQPLCESVMLHSHGVKCPKCTKVQNMERLGKILHDYHKKSVDGMGMLMKGQKEGVSILSEYLKILEKYCCLPTNEYLTFSCAIKQFYRLQGNTYRVSKLPYS